MGVDGFVSVCVCVLSGFNEIIFNPYSFIRVTN